MSFNFHLTRRGDESEPTPVSSFAALVFFLTCIAFAIVLFAISYTLGHVLPTLCMIESPETAAYVPVDVLDSGEPPAYTAAPKTPGADGDDEDEDAEILLVKNRPITSSLRKTIFHLRTRGGYWSCFRGLSLFLVWHAISGMIISALSAVFHNRLGVAFAAIIAETILARWHMTWVHIVISEPSQQRWYQRVPPWNTWRKIAPAVALWALSSQIVSMTPILAAASFGSLKNMNKPDYEPGRKDLYAIGAQGVMGMFIMIALFVLVQIPATVTLVRVSASMLPEEDETIVPFDRTFGGQTTPAIIGGQGKIGLVQAWNSFPWASRIRLVKLSAKVAGVAMAAWFIFTIVVVAEAHILFGDRLGEMMKTVHGVAGPR